MVTKCSWTPPFPQTVCSSGTSPSMQMLSFHREQTEWRSLQSADRNSWECIWGLTFQSIEHCWTVQLSANLLLHVAFLRHNRGFTVAGSTVDMQCSCLQRLTDRIQLSQYKSGQFIHQTRPIVEGDPNPASVNSCHQVKSFGVVHVVLIHDWEWFGSGGSNTLLHLPTGLTQLHLHNCATMCWLMTAKLTFCVTFGNSLQLIISWVFRYSIWGHHHEKSGKLPGSKSDKGAISFRRNPDKCTSAPLVAKTHSL